MNYGTIQRDRNQLGLPEQSIILTFDDGPVPNGQTKALLEVLKEHDVKAVFCLVGNRVKTFPDIAQSILADGHLVANHGMAHRVPGKMSDDEFFADLEEFDQEIRTVSGNEDWKSTFFRPAGGKWNERTARLLADSGTSLMPMTYFAWDIFPFPGREKAVLAGLLHNCRKMKGGIYMLHEAVVPLNGEASPALPRSDRFWIPEMVDRFIRKSKEDGFGFPDPRASHFQLNQSVP